MQKHCCSLAAECFAPVRLRQLLFNAKYIFLKSSIAFQHAKLINLISLTFAKTKIFAKTFAKTKTFVS
jgi:hypothetical protein